MPEMTVDDALQLAARLGQMGQSAQAVEICQQILRSLPSLADDPNQPAHLCNLGVMLTQLGRSEQAIELFQRALSAWPGHLGICNNLAIALRARGRHDEAISAYRQVLAQNPAYAEARNNLANALEERGQLDEAIAEYRVALDSKPDYADAWRNLGRALAKLNKLDEAIEAFGRALALRADFAEAHAGLGAALLAKGLWEEAIAPSREALRLKPDDPEKFYSLGTVLLTNEQMDEAITVFRRALELRPDYVEALSNLAMVLKDTGQLARAVACDEQALAIDPERSIIASNRLYTLHFHPDYDGPGTLREHVKWNEKYAKGLGENIAAYENDRSLDRKIRIGYVSADFRQHPVGLAIEPLLAHHDRAKFHVSCFYNSIFEDGVTARIRANAHQWHGVAGLTDEQLGWLIRDQKIDILVDLSLHMAGNRMLVFARKPAPVQVTYLGYPGTTGLNTIDYRLSDPFLDSPGTDESYTEKTIRLPRTYLCWRWNGTDEPVESLPALSKGFITFGSLNNFCKVTPRVLATWGKLMALVPDSRLILRCPSGETARRVRETMTNFGIRPERLELVGRLPWDQYVQLYNRQDIGLDPFPYPGHTTSLDGLWMGVPIVTLAGKTAASRGGVSILQNLGLGELIASDAEQYVEIARQLSSDLPRLSRIRASLRDRVGQSPLMDEERFARDVESAYRLMWQSWCAAQK